MTVAELIKILGYYPQDSIIKTNWKDLSKGIADTNIYFKSSDNKVYIDADDNSYKGDDKHSLTTGIASKEVE